MSIAKADIDLDSRRAANTAVIYLRTRENDPYDTDGKVLKLDVGRARKDDLGSLWPLFVLLESDGEIVQDAAATDPIDGEPTLAITIYFTPTHMSFLEDGLPVPYDLFLIDPDAPNDAAPVLCKGYLRPQFEVVA